MNDQLDDMEQQAQHLRMTEALLFAAVEPLDRESIAERLPDGADVPALLAQLTETYQGRGVNLVVVGGRWALRTAPDLAFLLQRQVQTTRRLSRAGVETLSIIAYHQPVTRAEIEEIRGVGISKGTLDVLLEAGWIKIKGRRRTPGRPVTFGTTDNFLDHFGLEAITDLPGVEELKAAGLLETGVSFDFIKKAVEEEDEGDDDSDEGDNVDDLLPFDPDPEDGDSESPEV